MLLPKKTRTQSFTFFEKKIRWPISAEITYKINEVGPWYIALSLFANYAKCVLIVSRALAILPYSEPKNRLDPKNGLKKFIICRKHPCRLIRALVDNVT